MSSLRSFLPQLATLSVILDFSQKTVDNPYKILYNHTEESRRLALSSPKYPIYIEENCYEILCKLRRVQKR